MKEYKFVLIILILFLGLTSYSQSNIKFGVELSGFQNFYKNTNNESSQGIFRTDESNRRGSLGFNFRFSFIIESDTKLNLSPGIRYFKGFNNMDISNHKATFLDLPIQLNVSLSKDWFVIAGLRFSYLSKFEREDVFIIIDPPRETNLLDDAVNKFFYIPKLGIGATFFKTLDLEITYNYSFSNLVAVDFSSGLSSTPSTYKNNFLQLSVIYNDIGSLFSKKKNK